jgi:uncharacterized protein (TIGR04255 family)
VKYKREPLTRAPLIEAVFEVRASCQASPALIPGAIYGRLKKRFPVSETAGVINIEPPEARFGSVQRFLNEQRTRLVQCGPEMFSVNVLGDYGEFPEYEALIREALEAFYAEAQPTKLKRLGIRYINLLKEEAIASAGGRPLRTDVAFPSDVLPSQDSIAYRGVFSFPKDNGVLGLAVANPHQLPDGRRGCLLDLDFFVENPTFRAVDDCLPWAKRGHDVVYDAFRSILTPEMYNQLGPVSVSN